MSENQWWSTQPPESDSGALSYKGLSLMFDRMASANREPSFVFVSPRVFDAMRRAERGWWRWWNWPGFALVMLACSVPALLRWLEGGAFDPRDLRGRLHCNAVRGELREDRDFDTDLADEENWW